jgi:hypothetical protein
VAVKSKCHIALAIAADWQGSARLAAPAERLKSYECASHPHSFDEGLVQCDHRGGKKAIAVSTASCRLRRCSTPPLA